VAWAVSPKKSISARRTAQAKGLSLEENEKSSAVQKCLSREAGPRQRARRSTVSWSFSASS